MLKRWADLLVDLWLLAVDLILIFPHMCRIYRIQQAAEERKRQRCAERERERLDRLRHPVRYRPIRS